MGSKLPLKPAEVLNAIFLIPCKKLGTNTEQFPKVGYFDEHFFLCPREQVVPSGDLGKRITWNRYLGVYSSGPQLDTSILPHGPYNTGLLLPRNSAHSGSTAERTFFIG